MPIWGGVEVYVLLVASHYRNRDKLRPGSRIDFTLPFTVTNHHQIFLSAIVFKYFLETVAHLLLSSPHLRTDRTTCF